jgi:hypothetical protein
LFLKYHKRSNVFCQESIQCREGKDLLAVGIDVADDEDEDLFSSATLFTKCSHCSNSTNTTTVVATTIIVSRKRYFREWKEKMDYGRCVRAGIIVKP